MIKRKDLKTWKNRKYWINYEINLGIMVDRLYGKGDSNSIIIPEYQRDYVWGQDAAPKFLTSLFKGYPIGNIIVWENSDEKQWVLIDGLQRNWTILKIFEKPFNYINYEMFEYWANNNGIELENENKLDYERFRHLRSSIHHKRNGYKKSTKLNCLDFINKSESSKLLWNLKDDLSNGEYIAKTKLKFTSFIEYYSKWFEENFNEINVPHIVLDGFESNDVADIFKIINSTGEPLSDFEIVSAKWSKYMIDINNEIKFISKFNDERKKRYKSQFLDPEKLNEEIIGFDNLSIIPSNFIYAVFIEAIKNNFHLKETFCKTNSDYEIISLDRKAVEPAAEIIKHVLIKDFKAKKDFEFEELGFHLKENIKTDTDVEKLKNKIKGYLELVVSSINPIETARDNRKNKGVKYPVWLIATFVIHSIYASAAERKEYNKWFIKELLFDNRLNSNTGTKAKNIIQEKEFNEKYNKENAKDSYVDLNSEIKILLDSENMKTSKYNDRTKMVILSLLQKKDSSFTNTPEIDHFIPQSKIAGVNGLEVDCIYNLQILPKSENGSEWKSDDLVNDQYKYDVFEKYYSQKQKADMSKLIEKLLFEIENGHATVETYEKIIMIRREVIFDNIIDTLF